MKFDNLLIIGAGILGVSYLLNNEKVGKLEDIEYPPAGAVDQYWGKVVPINYVGRKFNLDKSHLVPLEMAKKFNLRGIEFGNWMNQEDRVSHLAAASEGLSDLSKVLRVKPAQIGFKNSLAIALGARGRPKSAAHYESGFTTINMTKVNGKYGSLAHEYFHYLDNLVGRKLKNENILLSGRSTRKKADSTILKLRTIEAEYEKLFLILYFNDDGTPTKFYQDQMKRTEYYQSRVEVFARTGEAYTFLRMKELGLKNFYLVSSPDEEWPPLALVQKARKHIKKKLSTMLLNKFCKSFHELVGLV